MRIFLIMMILLLFAAPAFAEEEAALPSPRSATTSGPQDLIDLAEDGNVMAQFILGDIFSKGKAGVDKDLDVAQAWFTRAAASDHRFAMIRLAAVYKAKGEHVQAYKWYDLALDRFEDEETPHAYLENRQDELTKKMTEEEIDQAEDLARKWRPKNTSAKDTARIRPVFNLND